MSSEKINITYGHMRLEPILIEQKTAALLLRRSSCLHHVHRDHSLDIVESCLPDHDTAEALADGPLGLGGHHSSVIIADPLVSRICIRTDLSGRILLRTQYYCSWSQ